MGLLARFGSGSWERLEAVANTAIRQRDQADAMASVAGVTMKPFMEKPGTLDELISFDRVIAGKDPVAAYIVIGSGNGIGGRGNGQDMRRALPMYLHAPGGGMRLHSALDDARTAATRLSRQLTGEWQQVGRMERDPLLQGRSVATGVVEVELAEGTRYGVASLVVDTPRGLVQVPAETPFNPFVGRRKFHPDSIVAQIDPTDPRLVAVHGARSGAVTSDTQRVVIKQGH